MEVAVDLIEPLLVRAEKFGKTNLELLKLKTIDKTAAVMSRFISRMVLLVVVLIFALTLNVGISLLIGEILGKNYYGFLAVAAAYGVLGIFIYVLHPSIKARVNHMIIA